MNRINRVNSKRYGFTILDNFQVYAYYVFKIALSYVYG